MNLFPGLVIAVILLPEFADSVPAGYGVKDDDDRYERFYYDKAPLLKASSNKAKQFFVKHLSWFPMENLWEDRKGAYGTDDAKMDQVMSPERMPFVTTAAAPFRWQDYFPNRDSFEKIRKFTEEKFAYFRESAQSVIKKDSELIAKPVLGFIARSHLKDKIDYLTHPFRPRVNYSRVHDSFGGYPHFTTRFNFFITSTEDPQQKYTFGMIGPTIRILKKKKKRSFRKRRRKLPYPFRGIREKRFPPERHQKSSPNDTSNEMGIDLAGKMTNMWKCMVNHRNPQVRDVKYFLYTRRNVIEPEMLAVNYDLIRNKSAGISKETTNCSELSPEEIGDFERISDDNRDIIKSNFLSLRAPTKIIIHGYTGSHKDIRMVKIKDAYLTTGRFNVIQVDWEMLAAPPCYIRVTHHSRFVGEALAKFLDGLHLIGLNMSLVHVVGFSLGAQVAGFAGNLVETVKICRITGLDPALPLFLHTNASGHLDKTDGEFVDVIHTCGGILAMFDPVGHVDFYPNGGTRQPGCDFSNLKCSHNRALEFFEESISSSKKFVGTMCGSWEEYVGGECNGTANVSLMGEPCSRKSVAGKYYLSTRSKEPFAI